MIECRLGGGEWQRPIPKHGVDECRMCSSIKFGTRPTLTGVIQLFEDFLSLTFPSSEIFEITWEIRLAVFAKRHLPSTGEILATRVLVADLGADFCCFLGPSS